MKRILMTLAVLGSTIVLATSASARPLHPRYERHFGHIHYHTHTQPAQSVAVQPTIVYRPVTTSTATLVRPTNVQNVSYVNR